MKTTSAAMTAKCKRYAHAWIWNCAVCDELYEKYSIRPNVGLDCECTVHCSFRRSPLDRKFSTCNNFI